MEQEKEIQSNQYLTFNIASEQYAIDILKVKEIIAPDTITRVPQAPVAVRGVINLRGKVVPVIDLRVRLGLPESSITKLTCIIIVEVKLDGRLAVMGIITDSVDQVINFPPEDIEQPPAFGTRVAARYLKGLGKHEHGFVLILDIDNVMSENEYLIDSDAVDSGDRDISIPCMSQTAGSTEAGGPSAA